jgi:alpha-D-ribose 1-methylphosphonate 5-triphosphate synthase subunit PhnG
MALRQAQVTRIMRARAQWKVTHNWHSGSSRAQRARASAVLDALLRNSSEEEWRQAYNAEI